MNAKAKKDQFDDYYQLYRWKKKLETARNNWDYSIMDEREMLYNGTHDVDPNINNPSVNRKLANNVQNIIYEFIEAQVDTIIPQPTVKSKRKPTPDKDYTALAQMIEDSIKNDLMEMDIERVNDENERITPIQGFSLFKMNWNPDFKHHLYRGEIEITNPHPKALLSQPGVFNVQKMDYFFLLYSVTKAYVKKRYGVELGEGDGEEFPEINYFAAEQYQSDTEGEKVTVIEVWYKDEDGDIGKFVWANETPLENLPKFYYRRLKRCTRCGEVKGTGDECEMCGNKKFKDSIEENEFLAEDIQLMNGEVIPAGTAIPYFKPTRYPLIIRRNVPVNFQLGGQSDVDVIRDQADALKKVVSRIEEKIIRGGAIIVANEDHRFQLTNDLYQIIRGSQSQLNALDVKTLTADIQAEIQFAQYLYRASQDTLGVTNAWMGKEDPTAKSGVAKQIQVQQASGRIQSKLFNKYYAYKQLFELMFQFKLAYYDELRPFIKKGEGNRDEWGDFNKYEFLEKDASGQWYYNTDFLFYADPEEGLPRDKMWVMQTTRELAREQLLDKAQVWTILDAVGFPMAAEIKEQALQEKEMAMQAPLQLQPQLQPAGGAPAPQLPPEYQEKLMALPPDAQQILSRLSPDEIMRFLDMSPEQQMALLQGTGQPPGM